jgi:HSP20 family molecular chaperone IbpA
VLTIEGEREAAVREGDGKATAHVNERFEGRFHRVVSLPTRSGAASRCRWRESPAVH